MSSFLAYLAPKSPFISCSWEIKDTMRVRILLSRW